MGAKAARAISEKLCGLWLRTVTPPWDRPLQRIPALVARVSNSLGSVLRRVGSCGALPYAWSSPRASAHTVRACREGAGRPHGQYPPHTDPRIPHRVTQLSCERSLHPCMLLTMRRGPRTRHPEPQARRVRARGQAHYTARGDCPRSRRGRHEAVVLPLSMRTFVLFLSFKYIYQSML